MGVIDKFNCMLLVEATKCIRIIGNENFKEDVKKITENLVLPFFLIEFNISVLIT